MTHIEAILNVLAKEIQIQQVKMAQAGTNLETQKLDCLTMAKHSLEEFIRLTNIN
jgi:hypothetical protein